MLVHFDILCFKDVHAEPGQAEDVFADTISNQPSQKVLSDESLSSSTRRSKLYYTMRRKFTKGSKL